MSKICSKCGHTMYYDPYFEKLVCRGCGHTEFEKIRPKPLEEVNSSQYEYIQKMRDYVTKLESQPITIEAWRSICKREGKWCSFEEVKHCSYGMAEEYIRTLSQKGNLL